MFDPSVESEPLQRWNRAETEYVEIWGYRCSRKQQLLLSEIFTVLPLTSLPKLSALTMREMGGISLALICVLKVNLSVFIVKGSELHSPLLGILLETVICPSTLLQQLAKAMFTPFGS